MQVMWDKLHKNHKLDEDAMRILEYPKNNYEILQCYSIRCHRVLSNYMTYYISKPQAN